MTSVTFGPLSLANRWAAAPMVTLFPAVADRPTGEHIKFYARRAQSRPGLFIVGATYVSPEGKGFPNQMGIDADEKLPAFRQLAARIQEYSPALLQLFHAGPKTSRSVSGRDVVAPVGGSAPRARYDAARGLTGAEIEEILAQFEAASWRAFEAGFAGIELHGGNGYLLQAFADPQANLRTDAWGDPLAVPTSLARRLRERLPGGFLVGYTLSPFFIGANDVPSAQSLEWFARLGLQLSDAGVDYLHIYRGKAEPGAAPRAFSSVLRERGIRLPIIEGAGVASADDGRLFLDQGATLVAVGRALLGCPDLLTRPDFQYSETALALLGTTEGIREAFAAEAVADYKRQISSSRS